MAAVSSPTTACTAPMTGRSTTPWNTNNTVAAHDIAVLRLYEPIGSWLGWMGTKVYDPGWQGGAYWTLTGYPAMVAGAERPSYESSIAG